MNVCKAFYLAIFFCKKLIAKQKPHFLQLLFCSIELVGPKLTIFENITGTDLNRFICSKKSSI